ncbi:TonB-dependent receptor [Fluviicola taffensis]|uniref:TonB-dependent receptor n=1 Tax=Fluviicola taffensis (strain DSM 16823 / NCIMB 13979 / RW262) TaxID=755732 RepID=F2IHQ9_FLUTR|nr:TonB-dependent receptor [Fluviicola taffensis]AEA44837.1 TonB-dependent receptor [Fluviicola taffensis DSM 16823]
MKIFLSVVSLMIVSFAFGQDKNNGVIQGKVIDSETGEGLPSAQVELVEQTKKILSDIEGVYNFDKLEKGSYSIRIVYPGMPTQIINGIEVKSGNITNIDVVMTPPNEDTIVEVVITAKRIIDTDQGVALKQKNAVSVGDVMSSQSIARSTASNTSDVLKMVSGASIQDNKFAVIRGLNDRYNAAFLNGSPLPSSESDRKAFSFDIFPSNMLDNLTITKSATPEQPAEFAGGLIQINTKSIPEKNFFSFQLGTGYNTITTFKDRTSYKGGKMDWLGIDDGNRKIPSSIPSFKDFPTSMHDEAKLAKTFSTDWKTTESKFSPNLNLQASGGFNKKFGKMREFGMIAALTYSRSFSYNETTRRGYLNANDPNSLETSQLQYEYFDKNNVTTTLSGALANFSLKINELNTLSFKNIYSINSTDKLISRTGENDPLQNPTLVSNSARWFTSNQVYSGQLEGQHGLKVKGLKINWLAGYSNIYRSIPNLRRSAYSKPKDPVNPKDTMYSASISFTNAGQNFGGGMFFSDNKESSTNARVDLSYTTDLFGKIKSEFKIGVYNQIRSRKFEARQLGYTRYGVTGGNVKFDNNLLYLPEDEIFAPENMGLIEAGQNGNPGKGGFKLTDDTKPSDNYDAQSMLNAAYLQIDNRFGKRFRFIYGVRAEYFDQKLNALRDNLSDLKIRTTKLDFLPSINGIFEANKRTNIRLSYSQTLNRPEYRELAPFAFYDFSTNFVISGNDTLKRALIHNLDLRYEVFPGRGQLFSATVFYKNFQNPIEQKSRADVTNEITYQNVPTAQNYGLELEARTLISNLFGLDTSSFFDKFTVYANLSIIRSKVDVSTVVGSATDSRPLQGQSPYVFNAGIRYDNSRYQWGVSLNVNRVGQRIYYVGNVYEPDLWEQARTFLDLQITKGFWKGRAQFKLNIQNILAQNQIFYQNSSTERSTAKGMNAFFNTIFVGDKNNNNNYDKSIDREIWNTNFGTTFSASISIKL